MFRFFLIFLASLLTLTSLGCSQLLRATPESLRLRPLKPYTVRFADGTTEPERKAFEDAYERWNERTYPENRISTDQAHGNWLVAFVPELKNSAGKDVGGLECTYRNGSVCPQARFIRLRRGMSAYDIAGVGAHELGHALQLEHLPQPGALMNTNVTETAVSTYDLSECRRVGACP